MKENRITNLLSLTANSYQQSKLQTPTYIKENQKKDAQMGGTAKTQWQN